ncbi:hypothetical protein SCP_0308440 [Sparassis crispa]|uniref:Uncharacterized protein n=1 Tax=Sparassis crispa TaxID=139825 RepID=A0A401GG12_9APHY|nr:hypothetical protein SCP_0308440 [Sparassis crispa]GBE81118.1 hypothetical protein SCP_0308440 [Sparassis crispa]
MMGEGERALFRATSARADSPARTRFARVRRATIAELVTARGGELRQSARPSSYLLRPCFPLSPLLLSLLLVFPFSVPFLPIAVLAGDRDHQPSPLAGATRGTPGSRCALGGPRGPHPARHSADHSRAVVAAASAGNTIVNPFVAVTQVTRFVTPALPSTTLACLDPMSTRSLPRSSPLIAAHAPQPRPGHRSR